MPIFTLELLIAIGIGIACVTAETILLLLLSKRYQVSGRPKTLIVFLIALGSLWFADGSTLIAMFIDNANLFILVQKFSLSFSMISICFLLFFFEAFEHDTIFTGKQMLHTALGGMVIMSILLGDFHTRILPKEQILVLILDPFTEILTFILPGIASIMIILSLSGSFHDTWIFQKRQLKMMIIGLSIAYLVPIILKPILLVYPSVVFAVFLRADVAIGFIIYFISFGSSENFGLFNRHRADKIMIVDLNGLPVFTYNFKQSKKTLDDVLFAGGVVALTSLMKEATQSSSPISEVKLEDQNQLLLEIKSSLMAIILTPKVTEYQRDGLKRFAAIFDKNFGKVITNNDIRSTDRFLKEGKQILFGSFGLPSA